jgi:formylglycine-generating enzyme required for sulfatase activity
MKFCESLNAHEKALGTLPAGYRYRLPTDEEWGKLVGGQKLDGAISSLFERQKSTAPVGSLAPNDYGLYDVRGNVWEWVNDWYSQTIVNRIQKEGATPNPEWVGTDRKVLRGGAWNRSGQFDLAVGNRMGASPSSKDRYDVGFRVVLIRD